MKSKITNVRAYEVFDSRGNPTVACQVYVDSVVGNAMVPSGASTGTHEAWELRDGDKRLGGKGVRKACRNINTVIKKKILGLPVTNQKMIDQLMIDLDGTPNKKKLGANAILAVSLAVSHAAALVKKQELFKTFVGKRRASFPLPLFNVINGGAHADNGISVQEYMVIPTGARKFSDAMERGSEVFLALKALLHKKGFSTAVGDEGGFAPRLASSEAALVFLAEAIRNAGFELGRDVHIGLDVAASEFYRDGVYHFDGKKKTGREMQSMYARWIEKFSICSLEDPFAEDAWDDWTSFTEKFSKSIRIIGDDLLVTNPTRLQEAIERKACNAVLVKLNQIGTITETRTVIDMAQKEGWGVIISHRSGETDDTTISDLALGVGADALKAGSLSRGERLAKYNRLLELENTLKPLPPFSRTFLL